MGSWFSRPVVYGAVVQGAVVQGAVVLKEP